MVLRARFLIDREIDFLFELFGLFEVDDFVFPFDGRFYEIDHHFQRIIDEGTVELWVFEMTFLLLHNKNL